MRILFKFKSKCFYLCYSQSCIRFYSLFNQTEIEIIRNVTMRDVITRVTKIESSPRIQENVFTVAGTVYPKKTNTTIKLLIFEFGILVYKNN